MKTIRADCPFCGHQWAVINIDSYDSQSIACQNCKVKFELQFYEVKQLRDAAVEEALLAKYMKRPK